MGNVSRKKFFLGGLAGILAAREAPSAIVRSIISGRAIVNDVSGEPYVGAESYVQDGLVCLYDAIENVGWGIHDSNARQWTDLTGNESPLTFRSNSHYWYDTYVYCGMWMQNPVVARSYPSGVTSEWVSFKGAMTLTNSSNFCRYEFLIGGNYAKVIALGKSNEQWRYNNAYSLFKEAQTISAVIDSNMYAYLYGDGGRLFTRASSGPLPSVSGSGRISLGIETNNAQTYVNCYRIYNRALSDEEIAYNHQIDVIRFGVSA